MDDIVTLGIASIDSLNNNFRRLNTLFTVAKDEDKPTQNKSITEEFA